MGPPFSFPGRAATLVPAASGGGAASYHPAGTRPIHRFTAFATAPLNVVVIAATTLGVAVLLARGEARPVHAADPTVSIVDFAFEPATVTVNADTAVTWTVTRARDPHTLTPVDPPDAFEPSALLKQGDAFTVTFSEPGTDNYECTIHPEDMRGTVIVVAGGATPTAAPGPSQTPGPSHSPAATPSTEGPTPTAPGASVGSALSDGGLAIGLLVLGLAAGLAGAGLLLARRRRSS